MSDLLRLDAKFGFTEAQRKAFKELKLALVSEPVLKLYNPKLRTDASKYGYGPVLLQKYPGDNMFHPVHFMSRKTKPCEENYSSTELGVYQY